MKNINPKKRAVKKNAGIEKKVKMEMAAPLKNVKKKSSTRKASIEGLKKHYLESKDVCRVTFKLSSKRVPNAGVVNLVGDFNKWNDKANIMKIDADGYFTATIDLKIKHEYQFRYFIEHCYWENDLHADKYTASPYGSNNSVVVV